MKRSTSVAVTRCAASSAVTRGRRSALDRKPVDVCECVPTRTLSHTVMLANRARFWNVRPIPSPAMSLGADFSRSRPSKRMLPWEGS